VSAFSSTVADTLNREKIMHQNELNIRLSNWWWWAIEDGPAGGTAAF
jgi:hypothetical protein